MAEEIAGGQGKQSRRQTARGFVLRMLVISGILGVLAFWRGDSLAQALLPLFRQEIEALDDTYRIDRLALDHDGSERVIRIDVGLAHSLVLNGQTFYPDPRGTAYASTLVDNVTLPAILLVAVAFAWPADRRMAYAWRTIALVPALLLFWMLDVPIVLWAALWNLHVEAFDPHRFSPLLIWAHFLHTGGRLALPLVLGTAVGTIGSNSIRNTKQL